jgi:primosomal protein N'
VLGRVGVLDILCSQLTKRLRQRGIRLVVTRTLAAQLAYGTTEQLDASIKQLERLNRGDYISEQNLDRFARAFGLRVEDLVFSHPAIYEVEAWKRRKKETQMLVANRRGNIAFISCPAGDRT